MMGFAVLNCNAHDFMDQDCVKLQVVRDCADRFAYQLTLIIAQIDGNRMQTAVLFQSMIGLHLILDHVLVIFSKVKNQDGSVRGEVLFSLLQECCLAFGSVRVRGQFANFFAQVIYKILLRFNHCLHGHPVGEVPLLVGDFFLQFYISI